LVRKKTLSTLPNRFFFHPIRFRYIYWSLLKV